MDEISRPARRKPATLVPEEPMTDELLAELQPSIRTITLLRTEEVYRNVSAEIAEAGRFDEKGVDPRLYKLQLDALAQMAKLAKLDKPPLQVAAVETGPVLGAEDHVNLVLVELERVQGVDGGV